MTSAHLGNVKFPELKVKAWDGGPGYFQPTSVTDIVAKVAFRFVKPSDEEQILLEALRTNERLVDPSSAKTILNSLTREIPKIMTFMAVIREAKEMRNYYYSCISSDQIESWLHQGVFTNYFMGQLLLNVCIQDYFSVSLDMTRLNYVQQLEYLYNYANNKLNHFLNLRNINACSETATISKPTTKKEKSGMDKDFQR